MSNIARYTQLLILRELDAFKRELAAFQDDAGPWKAAPGISNTAGTLALHCAGNLQHFIGAHFGGTGYVRHRDLEFSRRDVARAELSAELDRAVVAVRESLTNVDEASLAAPFPEVFGGKRISNDMMLMHLAVHLAYHLGQADYHRRMTSGDSTTVNAVAATELPAAD